MQGLMMNRPLKISDIITYAAEAYPSAEIVSVRSEGDIHRTNYLDISKRMAQLAHGLISISRECRVNISTGVLRPLTFRIRGMLSSLLHENGREVDRNRPKSKFAKHPPDLNPSSADSRSC